MLICVTNRKLCKDNFINRIEELAKARPYGIMLREKDLDEAEYEKLAVEVKKICDIYSIPLIINKRMEIADKLNLSHIHLSMPDLRKYKNEIDRFQYIGASVHSLLEAMEAEKLGATYLVAGHIFSTDCKRNIPPRGLNFLKAICENVKIPVYAIGGISKDKIEAVKQAGAAGACIMSEAMTCADPYQLINDFWY